MSNVKYNFLNWQPDKEDYENEGLVTADNLIHQPEGYKEYKYKTASGFVTNASIGTCCSIIAKPVGGENQHVVVYLHTPVVAGAGFTWSFSVGLMKSNNSVAAYTTITTGTVLSGSTTTAGNVVAFGAAELADHIFVSSKAQLASNTALSGGPIVSVRLTGYIPI